MGRLGPNEGLWVIVVLLEVTVDGGLEVDDGAKDAALETFSGKCGEEVLSQEPEVGVKWNEVDPDRETAGAVS
jgi:hypothetical protein